MSLVSAIFAERYQRNWCMQEVVVRSVAKQPGSEEVNSVVLYMNSLFDLAIDMAVLTCWRFSRQQVSSRLKDLRLFHLMTLKSCSWTIRGSRVVSANVIRKLKGSVNPEIACHPADCDQRCRDGHHKLLSYPCCWDTATEVGCWGRMKVVKSLETHQSVHERSLRSFRIACSVFECDPVKMGKP